MPTVVRNPPVDEALARALLDVWVAVTDAGGAVGFLRGATASDVRPTAEAALARVATGTDDLVVALDGRRPLAFGFLEPSPHPLSAHVGVVKRLQRDPRAHGRGLGASVLAAIEFAAVARGLVLATLTVRGGTGTEAFYEAHGWRVDGRLPARLRLADGSLAEEVHMSKQLGDEVAQPRLAVQRLDPGVPLPSYAHDGDAGLDLVATHDVTLAPGGRASVGTGVAVAVPPGCVGLVHPRSGLAARHGVGLVNAPGTVDAGYRGEVRVLLVNHDLAEPVTLRRGDRVAQLVVQRVERVAVVEAEALDQTPRGTGGFGSTGR